MGFMSLCSILQLETGQEKRSRVFGTSGTWDGPTSAVCKLGQAGQAGTNKPDATSEDTALHSRRKSTFHPLDEL